MICGQRFLLPLFHNPTHLYAGLGLEVYSLCVVAVQGILKFWLFSRPPKLPSFSQLDHIRRVEDDGS